MEKFFYIVSSTFFIIGSLIIFGYGLKELFCSNQYQIKKLKMFYAVYYRKNIFRPWVKITMCSTHEQAVEFINQMDS